MPSPTESKPASGLRLPPPLRFGDFRALGLSTLATGMAFTGERVAVGWILLDRSDSPFVVGFGIAVSMIPNLILGVPSGLLADRFDRRLLIQLSGAGAAVNAALLASLSLLGVLDVWHLLILSFVGGSVRTLSSPARQTYAFDIVGPSAATSAMALINLGQRLGGIAGGLVLGAILAGAGEASAFFVIASAHLGAVGFMLFARSRGQAAPASSRARPIWEGFSEYIAEMKSNRTLLVLVVLTAAVEVLGFSYQALLPSIARDRLEIGAEGLGLMNAVASGGGMVAILFVTLRNEIRHKGLVFLVVLQVFGAAMILLGVSWTPAVAILAAVLISSLAALSDLFTQSLMQSAVPNELRGRAMGSWSLAIGLGPLGSIQIGALAALLGVTFALSLHGAILLILGASVLGLSKRLRQL